MSRAKPNLRKLISFGTLNDSIEDENIPKGLGLEDKDVLVLGFFDMENAIDLEGHRLACNLVSVTLIACLQNWRHTRPLRINFAEPAV